MARVQLRFLVCEIARFRDGARRSSKRHQRLIYLKWFSSGHGGWADSHQLSAFECRHCKFLYDLDAEEPYFLEVNTRLQVEHTVTEEVYGVDLVRAQIDLVRGRSIDEVEPNPRGWAFEARVCRRCPHNFMPAPGKLVRFVLPSGPGLRIDTGFNEGDVISADFDHSLRRSLKGGPRDKWPSHALARTGA